MKEEKNSDWWFARSPTCFVYCSCMHVHVARHHVNQRVARLPERDFRRRPNSKDGTGRSTSTYCAVARELYSCTTNSLYSSSAVQYSTLANCCRLLHVRSLTVHVGSPWLQEAKTVSMLHQASSEFSWRCIAYFPMNFDVNTLARLQNIAWSHRDRYNYWWSKSDEKWGTRNWDEANLCSARIIYVAGFEYWLKAEKELRTCTWPVLCTRIL